MPYRLSPPPMNPLSRLLAGLLAVLALVGAFFFGLVVLALAVGLGLLAWLALALRLWWLRRHLDRAGGTPGRGGPDGEAGREAGRAGNVIDADYEVVSRDRED
jgi:hypothetical protein